MTSEQPKAPEKAKPKQAAQENRTDSTLDVLSSWKLSKVRKLPIVGDVHLCREQWPSSVDDWRRLWGISPHPIKLAKIVYSVNAKEQAFNSIKLQFANQNFEGFDLSASDELPRKTCPVKLRKPITQIRIKQRNSLEGISKVCGIWLLSEDGTDAAKIDLAPGLGTWRYQTVQKTERIIGFHYYVVADDESIGSESSDYGLPEHVQQARLAATATEDSEWLDSFGFIVYDFKKPEPVPFKPYSTRGRPYRYYRATFS